MRRGLAAKFGVPFGDSSVTSQLSILAQPVHHIPGLPSPLGRDNARTPAFFCLIGLPQGPNRAGGIRTGDGEVCFYLMESLPNRGARGTHGFVFAGEKVGYPCENEPLRPHGLGKNSLRRKSRLVHPLAPKLPPSRTAQPGRGAGVSREA